MGIARTHPLKTNVSASQSGHSARVSGHSQEEQAAARPSASVTFSRGACQDCRYSTVRAGAAIGASIASSMRLAASVRCATDGSASTSRPGRRAGGSASGAV
jgi:hypothetical protein